MMVTKSEMQAVLQRALNRGGDFAELFFEDRDDTNIRSVDGSADGVRTKHIFGAGLSLLSGTRSVYVYSNNTSYSSLLALAERAGDLLQEHPQKPAEVRDLCEANVPNPNRVLEFPCSVSCEEKLRVVLDASKAMADAGPTLLRRELDYCDTDRRIVVANSEGLLTRDRRITSRLRAGVTCGDGRSSFFHWEEFNRPQGFEIFRESDDYLKFVGGLVRRTENMRIAQAMKPGVMPVVLAAGACGTLWHECCGHALEATAISARSSLFVDQLGKCVASEKVTLIDDGTLPGYYGTDAIDDEGHPRQKNVLIDHGVLKSYLCDRLHGRMIGCESTGNGRRQDYTFAPVARMTNTYLAAGTDSEEETIRSVENGLFVQSLGGGFGGMQFSIEVAEGFLIRNGQLGPQIKGIMLTGSGAQVMKKIDRVCGRVGFDSGSFCGAASGLVPVTAKQPMVRISEMALG